MENPSVNLGNGKWATKSGSILGSVVNEENRYAAIPFDFSRASSGTTVNRQGLIELVDEGVELVVNGDFSDGEDDWVFSNSSLNLSGAEINNIGQSNANSYISSVNVGILGLTYKFTYDVLETNGKNLVVEQASNVYLETDTIGVNREVVFEWTKTSSSSFTIKRYLAETKVTIDNVRLQEVLEEYPRIDFSEYTDGALLLEPQSTNILNQSNYFEPSPWGNYESSLINNKYTSPSGDMSASKLIESNSLSIHRLSYSSVSITAGQSYTLSVFAKKESRDHLSLTNYDGGTDTTTWFDLSNGEVVGGIGSIKPMGDGWYRCSKSFTAAVTTTSNYVVQVMIGDGASSYYQGDGVSGLYVYGAQLEALPYATSYIPTYGSIATRAAEMCDNGGVVTDFNSNEGVLYVEASTLVNGADCRITLSDGTITNRVSIEWDILASTIKGFTGSNGNLVSSSYNQTDSLKIAVKFKEGDAALWINGIEVDTDTSTSILSGINTLEFSNYDGNKAFEGRLKDLRVYKKALTDAELITLTTL